MKTTLKYLVLGFISLMGCSCGVEDYENGNTMSYVSGTTTSTEVQHKLSDVLETMKGTYFGRTDFEGDLVIITQTEITIQTKALTHTIDLTTETPTEAKINCLMRFKLPDGRIVSLLLGWKPETPENRNLLFVKVNDDYISALERSESNLN